MITARPPLVAGSAGRSELVAELAGEGADGRLVTLVERPLPHALGRDQPRPGERLQVGGGGWLGDAELVGDKDHADPVIDQVSVTLGRKMRDGVAEPCQDLQPPRAGEGAEHLSRVEVPCRGRHRMILASMYSQFPIFLFT